MEVTAFFSGVFVGVFVGVLVGLANLGSERDQARDAGVMCFDAVSGERIWSKNCPEVSQ